MAALVGSLQRQWDRAAWQWGLRVERVGELQDRKREIPESVLVWVLVRV